MSQRPLTSDLIIKITDLGLLHVSMKKTFISNK